MNKLPYSRKYLRTSEGIKWVEMGIVGEVKEGIIDGNVTRIPVLHFLSTLEPNDVYGICEIVNALNQPKEIVIYYRR